MNSSPKISVIIPVYNTAQYLPECLDSIINQTYSNLEIILVNDGSTDNSEDICNEYARKDSRILVIHKENGGQSSARNRGLDIAQGDYISFIDSDDWIDLDTYRIILDTFQSHTETSVVAFSSQRVYEGGASKLNPFLLPEKVHTYCGLELLDSYVYGNTLSCMVTHHVYDSALLRSRRFLEGIFYEDEAFTLALWASGDVRLTEIPKALYYYRIREHSTTGKGVSLKLIRDLCDGLFSVSSDADIPRKVQPLLGCAVLKPISVLFIEYYRHLHSSSQESLNELTTLWSRYTHQINRLHLPYDLRAFDFWVFRWSPSFYLKYARYYQFILRKLRLSSKYS